MQVSVSGERILAASGKCIRAAGVYGSKKEYRSGLFLGRYFFVPCIGRSLKAGIRILQHELIGQLSVVNSAHPGQAPCPCWASIVPQLGKHRAHFLVKSQTKSNLLKDKIQASPNDRFGINEKCKNEKNCQIVWFFVVMF